MKFLVRKNAEKRQVKFVIGRFIRNLEHCACFASVEANVFLCFFWILTDQDDEQYYDFISGAAGMLAIAGIGVAAASAYYLSKKPAPTQPPFNLDNQTMVEVNNLTACLRLVFLFCFVFALLHTKTCTLRLPTTSSI